MARPIVIVDDSPAIRLQVSALLRELVPDVHVVEAEDLDGARRIISTQGAELVLLDLALAKGEQGADLVPELLVDGAVHGVVLMTGLGFDHAEVERARRSPRVGYIRKPVRRADLQAAIIRVRNGH